MLLRLHPDTEHRFGEHQPKCLIFTKHLLSQRVLVPGQHSAPLVCLGWQWQPSGPAPLVLTNERWELEKIWVNALTSASRWKAVVHFLPTQCWVSSRPFPPTELITPRTACKCFEIVNDMFLNNCERFHGYVFKIFHRWSGG